MKKKLILALIPLTLVMLAFSGTVYMAEAAEGRDTCNVSNVSESIPEDGVVVIDLGIPGGALMKAGGAGSSSDSSHSYCVLDTGFGTDELFDYYNGRLEDINWTLDEQGIGEDIAWSTWLYIDSDSNNRMGLLIILDRGGDWQTVCLHTDVIQSDLGSESEVPGNVRGGWMSSQLAAPEGARMTGSGGGGGENCDGFRSKNRHIALDTELGLNELHDYYKAQLKGTGWTLGEQGTGENIAWSTWSFTDSKGDSWGGSLEILKQGEGNWRAVRLEMTLIP